MRAAGKQELMAQREHFAKRKTMASTVPARDMTFTRFKDNTDASVEQADEQETLLGAAWSGIASCSERQCVLESSEWDLGLDEELLPPLQLHKYQQSEIASVPVQAEEMHCKEPMTAELPQETELGKDIRSQEEQQSTHSVEENVSASSHLESDDCLFLPTPAHLPDHGIKHSREEPEMPEDPFHLAHLVSNKRTRRYHNWMSHPRSEQEGSDDVNMSH
jgi:hypothetical protein